MLHPLPRTKANDAGAELPLSYDGFAGEGVDGWIDKVEEGCYGFVG